MPDPHNLPLGETQIERLIDLMARLRDPETGCPWDIDQDFSTIAPYTIEEAYEVADAIENGSIQDLKEELGDLLLQVIFHSQMARELGHFDFHEVAKAITDKMIRRHPHVFGGAARHDAAEQKRVWEADKAAERAKKRTDADMPVSALAGVATSLPALTRAEKLQKRAARVGFDWTNPEDIFAKLDEEADEIRGALTLNDPAKIEEEVGDLLFVAANIARRLNVDPETALRKANAKFTRRFEGMEALAKRNAQDFSTLTLQAQEALWQRVKKGEKPD